MRNDLHQQIAACSAMEKQTAQINQRRVRLKMTAVLMF